MTIPRIFPIFLIALVMNGACGGRDLIPLQVELTRSVSKLPFVIAADQGFYEKYGLDIEIRMPPPEFEGGIRMPSESAGARIWSRLRSTGASEGWNPAIIVDGLTPAIVKRIDQTRAPHLIAIAANDCILRSHIVGRKGLRSLEELKGKRLGISARRDTTTGFGALTLAQRMGWDPVVDISIKLNGHDIEALREGLVDAIVASEVTYAVALKEGFPILADTREWDVSLAGNSVMVKAGWLNDGTNRETARRFLKAAIEGLALFHQDRNLALRVLSKWHGVTDPEIADTIYETGRWLSRKPYPCYQGIANTLELYDSNEMRRFSREDFYDDSLVRELDESGFIDALYRTASNEGRGRAK